SSCGRCGRCGPVRRVLEDCAKVNLPLAVQRSRRGGNPQVPWTPARRWRIREEIPARKEGALVRYALIAACLLAGGYGVYYFGNPDDVTSVMQARAREREAIAKQLEEIQFQDETPKRPRTEFAQDRVLGGDAEAPKPIEIDAKRVMGYLEQICDIGPRQSGTT